MNTRETLAGACGLVSQQPLRDRLARARETYAATCAEEVTLAADERLLDLLRHGVTRTRRTVEIERGPDGAVQRTTETVVEERLETPKWVFDKLMPDSLLPELLRAGSALHLHRHEAEA